MEEQFTLSPIGYIKHSHSEIPRHSSVSELQGDVFIYEQFKEGIRDIKAGDVIVIIFCFHKSPAFTPERLITIPPHLGVEKGVFSTCSPVRPNPIGLSIVKVIDVIGNVIKIQGLDMIDGTPVIDIKPYVPYGKD